jgi:membrane-bound serine protease (ClpP class)
VWLAGAILLAVFVLPGAWDVPVVALGAFAEATEGVLWFRWSRRRRAAVGAEALVGEVAEVVERLDPEGRVKLNGELWRARTIGAKPAEPGARVRVLALEALTLVVEPAS